MKYDGKDPKVRREGEKHDEIAVLNLPLAPGDTLRTTESRKCEIQFDTGTVIKLNFETELEIETILAQSLSTRSKVTNLVLRKGQIYIIYRRYSSREIFQLRTPNVAVKLKNNTVAKVSVEKDGSADIQVKSGMASVLYGEDENALQKKKIKESEGLIVSKDHRSYPGDLACDADFELWLSGIQERTAFPAGRSFIPKTILRYPKAVTYFAQKYSTFYGKWVWSSLFGWVWRPAYNDYFPGGSWKPYVYGKWREINGHLFWVPEEPWGWAPYHLGLWVWDEKEGWLWIPASSFAPAWVAWDYYGDYYLWRPWHLLDWSGAYSYYYRGYGNYWGGYYDVSPRRGGEILRVIHKKQLKKRDVSTYPIPKKLNRTYNNVISALEKENRRVIASIEKIPKHLVVVKGKDLNVPKLQTKIIKFGQVLRQAKSSSSQESVAPPKSIQIPHQKAAWTFKRNIQVAKLREYVISQFSLKKEMISSLKKEKSNSAKMPAANQTSGIDSRNIYLARKGTLAPKKNTASFSKSIMIKPTHFLHLRDWNPDVRVAEKMGVKITYSGRTNEIQCPALGISSRTVSLSRSSLSSRGGFHSSSGGSSSGSGSQSGGSGSSGGGSRGGHSGGHSHSSSGSRGGGRVK